MKRQVNRRTRPKFTTRAWSVRANSNVPDMRGRKKIQASREGQKSLGPVTTTLEDHARRERRAPFQEWGLVMFYEGKLPADFKRRNPELG